MTSTAEQTSTPGSSTPEIPDAQIDCVLFDLDGVVYHGPEAIPGAVDGINWLNDQSIPVNYVTNNATRTAATVASQITELGISTGPEEVTTSAEVIAERLAAKFGDGAVVYLVGVSGLADALTAAGLSVTDSLDDDPSAIAQGMDPRIDYQKIVSACEVIRSGAEWWATNPDYSLLTPTGKIPGNGAFIDMMSRLTDREPIIVGKPAPQMMEFAASRLGAQRPLMVGDRLDTDIEGGRAAGFETALVLTGIHDIHDALLAAPEARPNYVLPTLNSLEALISGGARGECARIEAQLRATWAAIDAGETSAEAAMSTTDLPRRIDD